MTVKVDIQGIEAARRSMEQAVKAMKPNSAFGKALKATTQHAYMYARQITHIDTGALRASHRMQFFGKYAEIYPDPLAVRGDGGMPAEYGIYEHNRGGDHAFYARTVAEDGDAAAQSGLRLLVKAMP